ncbi:solute carrier family 66 member 3-like [Halichondria panicea]|uniref:solute carrier family 66 member 3-like n=1 Tax=Halichondria panicea TaxID=6063 RepID=UPI00312B7340
MDSDAALYISRALSYSVIALSFCMKFPQIIAIFSSKASKGLSARGYWMEIVGYLIGSSYGYFHGFHISTYGEAILLAMQSAVIIAGVVYYGRQWSLENAVYVVLLFLFCIGAVLKVIPANVLYILLLCALPLSAGSKLIQIMKIRSLQSQGDVSKLMWGLAAYGCAARLFTVLVEVKDAQVFLNFLVSLILNTIVVLQCIYYGNRKTD